MYSIFYQKPSTKLIIEAFIVLLANSQTKKTHILIFGVPPVRIFTLANKW